MKVLLRGLFVTLLTVIVAAQAGQRITHTRTEGTIDPVRGLLTLGGRILTRNSGEATAIIANCAEPVALAEVGFNGSDDASLAAFRARGGELRYVYLGFVGDHLDLAAVAGRWATASALKAFGLRSKDVPRAVAVVLLPKACPELTAIDWSILSPPS